MRHAIASKFRNAGQDDEPHLLANILQLRESLWRLLNQSDVDDKAHTQAHKKIAKAVARLRPEVTIDPHSGVLSRRITVQTRKDIVARVIDAIADFLTHREELLIKTCYGSDCDWMFVDRTKARRRRWRDTRTWGTISRARDYRNRQKQQG